MHLFFLLRRIRLQAVAFALACAVHGLAFGWAGRVTHVTDGDTVWVREGRARPVPVRLHGIDAPERCQDGGPEATAALKSRVWKREVTVEPRATDEYGRLVATLRLDGEDVGHWLVSEGHAWSPGGRWGRGPYEAAEHRARRQHRGLFARPATEPRLFRKANGPCPRAPRQRP